MYALVLVGGSAVLVPTVSVLWLANLPRWLFTAPPPRPGSVSVLVPPSGSGAAVRAQLRTALERGKGVVDATRALLTVVAPTRLEPLPES